MVFPVTIICAMFWGLRIIIGMRRVSGIRIWACLELNLLCFVFILLSLSNDRYSAVKYFLVQALGSLIFFLSMLLIEIRGDFLILMLLSGALLLKLAMAPFQFWLLNLLPDIDWVRFFILRTFQKFLPLYIFILTLSDVRVRVTILGIIFAIWGGCAASTLKSVIVYSSILGLSWIISRQDYSLALFFLRVYMLSFYFLRELFWQISSQRNSEVGRWELKRVRRVCVFIAFLRIRGIPPFLGFFPKILIIVTSWTWRGLFAMVALLVGRGTYIFIYMRICLSHTRWFSGSGVINFWGETKLTIATLLTGGGICLFCI